MMRYLFVFLIICTYSLQDIEAQRGFKHCDVDVNMGEYDFMAQSAYAFLAPGDTAEHRIVIYSGNNYIIFACGPNKLGDLQFMIYEPQRVTTTFTDDTGKERQTVEYKDELLFDSQNNSEGLKYYLIDNNPKTRRLTIKVIVPETEKNVEEAVDILIGKQLNKSKRFIRPRGYQW